MSGGIAARRRVALFSAMLLACCAQVPAPPEAASPAVQQATGGGAASAQTARARPFPPRELPLDQRERERAQTLMQENRHAEAAQHWEVLQLLHPEQPAYTEKLAEARSRATLAAAHHVQDAQRARGQGQTERAAALYLRALSADPANADAAQGLREIQSESDRRAYAGAPRGNAETPQRGGSRSAPSAAERRDLDSGIMLLHQGDSAAAVQALESYLRRYPRDDLGRRTLQDAYAEQARRLTQDGKKEQALAELEKALELRDKSSPELTRSVQSRRKDVAEDYYQQALRVQYTNLSQAISLFEKCLKYDPEHVQAARRLEQTRRMQENLRSIPDAGTTP
jgi:tetratricopeptide (TPR) repeat protein